ncbi:nucleotidyl transferase AbiEii/AbiGii toxin family protein [Rheinheimera muenzenbergensis]|uniref:Nucleotidyl transferase AbiEii/AbiGii toxin family protein n=1 Tax=Rheinheimera muenzenbergensis TaxID=1193628 RepID=A0ABU8C788_9GAMM
MLPEPVIFAEVADVLNITDPAIVEKDYFLLQLLRLLSTTEIEGYRLVFAGGTCLAKVYKHTHRMSEDIDLKLVPDDATKQLSNSAQRALRKRIHLNITNQLLSSGLFTQSQDAVIRNERRFFQLLLNYPNAYPSSDSLRTHIQLELTESELLQPASHHSVSSLYAEVTKQAPEIEQFACVSLESTAAEKLVSLLRRTALATRFSERQDDDQLIRHAYDLYQIEAELENKAEFKQLIDVVIATDVAQFGEQHPEFRADPDNELLFGLAQLKDPKYAERYSRFIGPLVYHPEPVAWSDALKTVQLLTKQHIG